MVRRQRLPDLVGRVTSFPRSILPLWFFEETLSIPRFQWDKCLQGVELPGKYYFFDLES